jgi:hypothetical protein
MVSSLSSGKNNVKFIRDFTVPPTFTSLQYLAEASGALRDFTDQLTEDNFLATTPQTWDSPRI